MHKAYRRKAGGSVMLTLPPAILDLLGLHADDLAGLEIGDGRLIINPGSKKHCSLEGLLAASDYSGLPDEDDQIWAGGGPAGRELL